MYEESSRPVIWIWEISYIGNTVSQLGILFIPGVRESRISHLDPEVGVHQGLALEWSVSIIGNHECSVQTIAIERNAVQEAEAEGPLAPDRFVEGFGGETKVELDAGRGSFAGRLAEEFPARVASKAVLREFRCRFVVRSTSEYLLYQSSQSSASISFVWIASYRENKGDSTANRLRAVELGCFTEPQLLVASGVLPADDSGTVEQDLDALASRQDGRDARVAV